MKPRLRDGQQFVVAGGFDDPLYKDKARVVKRQDGVVEDRVGSEFLANHAEGDTKVWQHVHMSPASKIGVYTSRTAMCLWLACCVTKHLGSQWRKGSIRSDQSDAGRPGLP